MTRNGTTILKEWDAKKATINEVYKTLLATYGHQGWWPLLDIDGENPTKTGSVKGYHPKNYTYPQNRNQRYEIAIGAILTQNTAWPNVEMALTNIKNSIGIVPEKVDSLNIEYLKELIKPAGFFNQKSQYIRNFTTFFISIGDRIPTRRELLALKGIGEETADSISLYAYKELQFVVDAYTKRVFTHIGIIFEKDSYSNIKKLFEASIQKDIAIYQEYHALIVEHAKRFYSKKPHGVNDKILDHLFAIRK